MRIGVIHATMTAVEPLNRALRDVAPDIDVCNFVNEELLFHANQAGGIDGWGLRNFYRLFMQAAESCVEGIIIACSIYSTCADQAGKLTEKPVIAIDQPMVRLAASQGKRIGILATTASAGPIEEQKILEESRRLGKEIEPRVLVCTDAFAALKSGSEETHNRILLDAAGELKAQGCDTIVLSQITMACAKKGMEELGIPILSSPDSGARYLIDCINKGKY